MFGVGPGALPSDAFMMGIDPMRQREMMDEALEAILGATTAGGFDVLGHHWSVAEELAAEHGRTVDRAQWRLVGPMHIAPTMDQARRDVELGLPAWVDYFRRVAALPLVGDATEIGDMVDAMNATGLTVIGTPEDAAAQIERLWAKSGGFGTYLFMAHDWADREATLRAYELFARFVMPRFQAMLPRLDRSRNWAAENRGTFIGRAVEAIGKAIQDHAAERERRTRQAG
jgi:limonene 1,2-monooxygenase